MRKKILTCFFLLMMIVVCTGCGDTKDKYSSKLIGSWYLEGNNTPAFTFYDDGTCEIDGEYGSGEWHIVNGNILKLENYYGESETAEIDSIRDGKLVLKDNGNTSVFFNSAKKKTENNSKKNSTSEVTDEVSSDYQTGNLEEDVPETYEGKYTLKSRQYDRYGGTINDKFLVIAINNENGEQCYLEMDISGKVYNYISYDVGYPILFEDVIVIPKNYETPARVLDNSGNDITSDIIRENEILIGFCNRSEGTIFLLYEGIDTYDSHDAIFTVKDNHGNVKWEIRESEMFAQFDNYEHSDFDILDLELDNYANGDGWFEIHYATDANREYFSINGDTGAVVYTSGYATRVVDGYLFANKSWADFDLYDADGKKVPSAVVEGAGVDALYLGEGLVAYMSDYCVNAIYDLDGNIAIEDANKFNDISTFYNGVAQVSMRNDADVQFTGFINTDGEFLFEPVETDGSLGDLYYQSSFSRAKGCYYPCDENTMISEFGEIVKYPERKGRIYYLWEDNRITSYWDIEDGKLIINPIEVVTK